MRSVKEVRRWMRLRCEHCGHRFRWNNDSRFSYGNRDGKVYHEPCIGYLDWRTSARERLEILAVALEVGNLSDRDVRVVIEMRSANDDERVSRSNMAFRVFRDLEKAALSTSGEVKS